MDKSSTQRFDHIGPIARVVAIGLLAFGVVMLAFWLQTVGLGEDFATVLVIVVFFSVRYWARKRPDQVRARFGPFGKIAVAARDSEEEISRWTYNHALLAGAMIYTGYGIAVVIAQNAVVILLSALYTWHLAVGVGVIVAAVAVAPHWWFGGDSTPRPTDPPAEDHDPVPGPWHEFSDGEDRGERL